MKKRKTYFICTFNYIKNILFFIILLAFIRLPLKLIQASIHPSTATFLESYLRLMNQFLDYILIILDKMIVLSIVLMLVLIIPEIINRIASDSLKNWVYSIWSSFYIRKFLVKQNRNNENPKYLYYNKAVQKSFVDIRKHNITYIIKLPNNSDTVDLILDKKVLIYDKLTSRFSDYSFSSFERYRDWIRLEGTKAR